ncbi:ABC transporter substrate-binding protein [Psychroserpens burtonensis]|uniref:ABC transporter substrate-binding protein n=1 Tax=Psychroserpens burtonensis TaxID=49278 RepID=A0A5C7BHV7_9FLAO|nr:helical backbone metal receptor [Psychroserpens burtonensis]TXE18552.1 ABC transporter substrate-binding protein [Psychroserpens burtonensis]
MKYQDQLKRTLEFENTPTRIVSLVPSQTELLVDLGLESLIVGVTKFCIHPASLRKNKTVVGGTKQVHFDKIKNLNPDIILCNKEENTKEMILELEKIAPVHLSDIYNLDDALKLIDLYGKLFSVEKKSEALVSSLENKYKDFRHYIKDQEKLKVAYFIWKNPWMVAANTTFIDAMLRLNSFDNYFGNLERYPEVDLNTIKEDLDVILLSSEPYPFKSADIKELRSRFLRTKVVLVDGEFFSWYGSRLDYAFAYFKTLHQDLSD